MGWYVRLGLIAGVALSVASVCLSLLSGAGRDDLDIVLASPIAFLIVMPVAGWGIGWLVHHQDD